MKIGVFAAELSALGTCSLQEQLGLARKVEVDERARTEGWWVRARRNWWTTRLSLPSDAAPAPRAGEREQRVELNLGNVEVLRLERGAVGEARPVRAHGGAARDAPPRLIGIVERRSSPPRQRHSARGVDERPEEAERVIRRREELDDSGTRPRDRRPRQSGTMRSYYNILPPGPRELRVEVQTSKVDDVEPLRTGPLGDAARQPPLVLPHDHAFAGRDRGGF